MDSEAKGDWHAPEEGKDFTLIKEWPIYSLPITTILAPEARDIFHKYEGKESAPLDQLCEDIATMVKKSLLYDFDESKVRGWGQDEDQRQQYTETMAPENPSLLGVCTDGVDLGLSLWKALGVKAEASSLGTTSSSGAPHATIRVTVNGRDRIINTASGSMPFGLVHTLEQLARVGPPQKPEVTLNLVQTGDQYGDPTEVVELKTNPLQEVAVFRADPQFVQSGKFAADDYVVNVDPRPEEDNTRRGPIISLINFHVPPDINPVITPIESRKVWAPDVERKRRRIGRNEGELVRHLPHE